MNDAGGPWLGSDPRPTWRVSRPPRRDGDELPIVAFTWTALTTLEQFGPMEVHGLEYYLPLKMAAAATSHIQASKGWFAAVDPVGRTRVRVTVDSGDSKAAPERADEIVAAMTRISPHEEDVDAVLAPEQSPVDFADPVPWRWWLGDGPAHTMTFTAGATKWSLFAVALTSEACRSAGLIDPVGVRVVMAERDA